ncbi:hypothetical protein FHX82_001509 [Amycolatopsis bartoniae]|nr:hypothetical protein [Amycolatopsis bartoniae]
MHAFGAHFHYCHDILTHVAAGLVHFVGWLV